MKSLSAKLLSFGVTAALALGLATGCKKEEKPAPEPAKKEAKAKAKDKPKDKPKAPPSILPKVSAEEPKTTAGDVPVPETFEAEAAQAIPPDNLEAELDNLEAEILGGG